MDYMQQYRGKTRVVQKVTLNQWSLELLNRIERLDACAENMFDQRNSYSRIHVIQIQITYYASHY